MSKAIETFFSAWAEQDAAIRDAQVDSSLGAEIFYADPRTEAPLRNAAEVKEYVGMFSKMAPGMPVSVAGISTTLNFVRATVRFGEGDQSQLGQYVIDLDDAGLITRMIGFVGVTDI
jgi:hypothetical protein